MSNIKFYTEEQVRRIAKLYRHELYLLEAAINTEKPIELPSDEEITQYLNGKYFSDKMFRIYFIDGAKWMKEMILNQSK